MQISAKPGRHSHAAKSPVETIRRIVSTTSSGQRIICRIVDSYKITLD